MSVGQDEVPLYLIGSEGYIGSTLQTLLASRPVIRIGNPRSRDGVGVQTSLPRAVPAGATCILLAAITGERACEANRQLAYETNIELVRRVCDLKFRKIVFTSTASVYGSSDAYATEESPVRPTSFYTETKLQAEAIVRSAGPHHLIARLAIGIGAGGRTDWSQLVNQLVKQAVEHRAATIYGPDAYRPYCGVVDLARGLLLLHDDEGLNGHVVNVGTTRLNLTKREVAQRIQQLIPTLQCTLVERPDPRNYRVSFAKFEQRCSPSARSFDQIIMGLQGQLTTTTPVVAVNSQ